ILVSNATPSLFPSVVPALAVAQTLVALLVASGGRANLREIEKSEAQLKEFAVYLKDSRPR
ncbi:MurR/RpiR family transcriptional regulator, partial [Bordetella hinzii]|nr:MurR/RpiR family transcriptional regulator [Bordetella hinzii]